MASKKTTKKNCSYTWRPIEKLRVVAAAESLSDEQLGEFLRREGLHEQQLTEWREAATAALSRAKPERAQPSPEAKRIKKLEAELHRKKKALAEAAALLVLKKSPSDLGGRGRLHRREEREVVLTLIDEAVKAGARLQKACAVVGLPARTVQRWKAGLGEDLRCGPRTAPPNRISAKERQKVLDIANSSEYRDLSPKQIVPRLADQGKYVASESTFYRVLREADLLHHRAPSAAPTPRPRPDHAATGPNQVWSWDISKQNGLEPAGLVFHADNGGPMKGSTMLATLQRLGVVASFSRPSVSDDNPYSEALFRTMKYRPGSPTRPFTSIAEARVVAGFVAWYNHEHLHSGIGFVTPADRHAGRHIAIPAQRREVYARAAHKRPERWSRQPRQWERPEVVRLTPLREVSAA